MEYFLLIITLPIVMLIFWLFQFVQLMLLEDELLPGRHDKILWYIMFMLLMPLAPIAFVIWKAARVNEKKLTSNNQESLLAGND